MEVRDDPPPVSLLVHVALPSLGREHCPSANLAVNVQSDTAHAALPETVIARLSDRRLRSAEAFCKKWIVNGCCVANAVSQRSLP
jgi:hypothetical protein